MNLLLSVNIGHPRDVEWRGRTVRTSIWKTPQDGRIRVGRLNIAGDRQADLVGHGGEHRAVMVYQMDSYRYWANLLNRTDFEYGQFGENFTVDGLVDSEVCIGDRFQIGTAIFEVSQPRVTCYRVGIRMNNPEMPALMVSHRRPGFYFRVIKEGEIGAGDQIEKIADGNGGMSVAEIDSLLYTPVRPLEILQRAVDIPALSEGWRTSFTALLAAAQTAPANTDGGKTTIASTHSSAWEGFRQVRVTDVIEESEDVRSFVLADLEGLGLPHAFPGQHIAVKTLIDPHAPPQIRMYSLSGSAAARTYRISVKRERRSGMSEALHSNIQAGEILEISAPRGTFVLADNDRPLVLLSAGIGITPLLAMLHASALHSQTNPREIWWLHGARDKAHHSFADEVRQLIRSMKNVHAKIVYSRPTADDVPGVDYDAVGHLESSLLHNWAVPADADYYLCGPAEFLTAISSDLKSYGVIASQINQEVFGPASLAPNPGINIEVKPPHLPEGEPGTGPFVSFVRSGLVVPWDPKFKNILELAEACSVPVKWSCRTGVCHYCECSLIGGKLRYSPMPLDPPAASSALICCSTPMPDSEIQLDI
jgi:ferredoxin-NADP reductase/MOSC domain-containing protein YiiM/ferredoxin